jgi:hypothetical protein
MAVPFGQPPPGVRLLMASRVRDTDFSGDCHFAGAQVTQGLGLLRCFPKFFEYALDQAVHHFAAETCTG